MTLPPVREFALENGFRTLLVERRSLPLVATALYYRVGSRDERTGETGMSHFLEHMMFKGTARLRKGEIDALTSKLGGSNNAFTDKDCTAYYFTLASDRWETALEIESDRMTGCTLDAREFEAEKNVVLEELAMGEDDPWNVLWQTTESLAFEVHPYHHPIIGWKADLERATVDDMRAFYRRHYGPNRAFLVCVGDFDAADAEAKVRAAFSAIEPVPERAPVPEEPETRTERRAVQRAPGSLTRIALCCRTCRMGERDDFVLDLIAHALGGCKSARLHRRLVIDEEIATSVTVHNEARLDPGLFWITAELRPGADPEHAEALIRAELETFVSGGITAAELKLARIQARASFLFEDETALDLALKLGRFEAAAAAGYRLLADVLPTYDALQRRDVRAVAKRYLRPDRWTVVWSLPEDVEPRRPSLAPPRRRRTAKRTTAAAPQSDTARR